MSVRALAVALVALSTASGAGAVLAVPGEMENKTGPCLPTGQDWIVCGSGPGALAVLDGTTSPSGKLAIAWRSRGGSIEEAPDTGSVENHVVRLRDGKSLGIVVGRTWYNANGMANHIDQSVAWSPDSNWLLVGDSNKWSLESIAVYAVDENASAIKGLGLFRAISSAAGRVLRDRVGASKMSSYMLDVAGNQARIADTGAVSLPMQFQVPKQDGGIDLMVKFKASRSGGRVTTTPIEVSVVKG